MKITSIELRPSSSAFAAVLSFRDPRAQNPYNVKGLTGLDADEITARFYSGSGSLSQRFYNLALQKREIAAKIGLNPQFTSNQTYSDLRDDLYRMIASSRTGLVEVVFKNGTEVVASISGFVSKLESDLMAQEPDVTITIQCVTTLLTAPDATVVDMDSIDPHAIDIQDLKSTAPHGLTFNVRFVNPQVSFIISDDAVSPTWAFQVNPVGGFLADDILHVSSELNDKQLYLTRGGVRTYLADVLVPGSVWPLMFPNSNPFVMGNVDNLVLVDAEYYATYWGV